MFNSGFGFLTVRDVGVKHHPRNSERNSPKSTKIWNREQMIHCCYKQCWQTLPVCWGGAFSAPDIPSCSHLEGFKGQVRTSIQFFLKSSAGCSERQSFSKPLNSFVTVQILFIPSRVQQRGHCCTKLFTDTGGNLKTQGSFWSLFGGHTGLLPRSKALGIPGDWSVSGTSQFIPAGWDHPALPIVPEPHPDMAEIRRRMEFGPRTV